MASRNCSSRTAPGLVGFISSATVRMLGSISRNSSMRLASSSAAHSVIPVRLLAGRLGLLEYEGQIIQEKRVAAATMATQAALAVPVAMVRLNSFPSCMS